MCLGLGKEKKMAKKKKLDTSKPVDENELSDATTQKIYRLYGVNTAMHLLRPGAKWEISNTSFTRWDDDRPCPTWDEVNETMDKIKAFEDSIPTIWTEKQIQEMTGQFKQMEKAMDGSPSEGKGGESKK